MKHFKIIRFAGLHYDSATLTLYKNNPELQFQSYENQLQTVFQHAFLYTDGFSRAMRSLGHEAYDIIYDLEILQKTWAKEKGVFYDSDRWLYDIVLKQIEYLKPDIVYFQDIWSLPEAVRKELKNRFAFIKLVVVYKGFLNIGENLADIDILLTCIPSLVEKFRNAGLKSFLVYHGFDDAVLEKIFGGQIKKPQLIYDFTFVGSSGYGLLGYKGLSHQARYWTLYDLIQKTNLQLWIHEPERDSLPIRIKMSARKKLKKSLEYFDPEKLEKLLGFKLFSEGCIAEKMHCLLLESIQDRKAPPEKSCLDGFLQGRLPKKALRKKFPERCHPPVLGIDMYRILSQSKVTLNKHTDIAGDNVGNMRMFEATGVGCCLLTDTGKNLPNLFEKDREVVTYTSIEECIEKVCFLIEHDIVRREIAIAGQKRTLRDHTVMNRAIQINEILQKRL